MKKKKKEICASPTDVSAKLFINATQNIKIREEYKREGFYKLGVLAAEFSSLEEHIHEILFLLVFNSEAGLYLVKDNNLEKNLTLVENVCNFKKYQKEKVEDLIKGIRAMKDERNALIHGAMDVYFEPTTHEPLIVTRRLRLRESKRKSIEKNRKDDIIAINRHIQKSYTFQRMEEIIEETKKINRSVLLFLCQLRDDKRANKLN
jgi:hypothetical protein